jgi:hypothetical protein
MTNVIKIDHENKYTLVSERLFTRTFVYFILHVSNMNIFKYVISEKLLVTYHFVSNSPVQLSDFFTISRNRSQEFTIPS